MPRLLWFTRSLTTHRTFQLTDVHTTVCSSVPEMLLFVRNRMCDAVLLSCDQPDAELDDVLLEIRRSDSSLAVLIECTGASTDDVIRLVHLGAFHIFSGGADPDRLAGCIEAVIARHTDRSRHPGSAEDEPWRASLVGNSEGMRRTLDVIRLVAARRSSVLITGETGTGKEMVARAIHQAGGRGHLPFVAVNCSAIPETLVESELFGYARGAFTGAATSRAGRFEQANGGTIFLDEVGELPLEVQAKLLRVLQEREVQRLGSSDTVKLNIRVIAATNVNLLEAVRQKTFREDLFYRLNVIPLPLPSLRDRASDIPALVEHFLLKVCEAEGLTPKGISRLALEKMTEFSWPGNVRQLEHAIEMAVVLSGSRPMLDIGDFPVLAPATPAIRETLSLVVPDAGLDFEDTVSTFERMILQQALMKCAGNKARAAQLLRMKRTTLLARIRSLGCTFGDSAALPEEACA